jgi:hypothetical protein
MRIRRNARPERLSDGVAIRTTPTQRKFLEQISEEHKIPLGESVRLLIDEAMERAGAC